MKNIIAVFCLLSTSLTAFAEVLAPTNMRISIQVSAEDCRPIYSLMSKKREIAKKIKENAEAGVLALSIMNPENVELTSTAMKDLTDANLKLASQFRELSRQIAYEGHTPGGLRKTDYIATRQIVDALDISYTDESTISVKEPMFLSYILQSRKNIVTVTSTLSKLLACTVLIEGAGGRLKEAPGMTVWFPSEVPPKL